MSDPRLRGLRGYAGFSKPHPRVRPPACAREGLHANHAKPRKPRRTLSEVRREGVLASNVSPGPYFKNAARDEATDV